ncbi:Nif3-like dinuclear metal center hexameric protein [Bifidobacterium callitrichos]|uniref:GTP cyclohydrolase 1 type 2 homolog n=1 Tax=Bifidobacterium callitrichos TaxID=762209 RepID=A0A2T3G9M7_9BIFI|nr:Nif3-like dinuclear metal center hexameric protein [Bifidobacterium callitrichos]PST46173.1 Nif3-like dinuclear metal center hexameric protein [Bifidobacterium callitrichos]
MPNLKQVVDVLESLYPLRYAEQWDEPGLIVGDPARPVTRIVFAADPTSAIVDEAIAHGADLLITHHPLFFRSVHQVSGLGFRGAIVDRLARAGCALWVGHTNADAAYRGVAQAAADGFGLVDQCPLVPVDDPASPHAVGLGRVGRLVEPVSFEAFARRVATALPIDTALGVQACGDPDAPVSTVAVLPGSGDSLFDEVRAAGVDVYVTSDLRHHPVTDAIEQARYEASMRAAGIVLDRGGEPGDGQVRPCFVNTPHSAIESMWFRYAIEDVPTAIERALGERPVVDWIRRNTDPWTFTIHSGRIVMPRTPATSDTGVGDGNGDAREA